MTAGKFWRLPVLDAGVAACILTGKPVAGNLFAAIDLREQQTTFRNCYQVCNIISVIMWE